MSQTGTVLVIVIIIVSHSDYEEPLLLRCCYCEVARFDRTVHVQGQNKHLGLVTVYSHS